LRGDSSVERLLRVVLLGLCLTCAAAATAETGNGWQRTLDRVAPAVVVMRVVTPRAFDLMGTGYQTATGFVVDAERGLILTNRHVVTPGPVVAEAVFLDNEEVDVQAVYRDPVHDFGFYRYDPAAVQFMQLQELDLAPERARIGAEIRVIGNDAGEKISILAGTIARLDREAPVYGPNTFNDFNTFYIQAASGTSGGSSGSPVIDVTGKVVALNAGGRHMAASSFYLPLERVQRALQLLREGRPVTRGSLQTVFVHRAYDEVRRLGLRAESESIVRKAFPSGTGMIVVGEIVPGGPADGVLEPGDVLLRVDEQLVNSFLPIEAVLDERVGQRIALEVERGGVPLRLELEVADLHAISPASYLEVGGAVLNPLSYQQARNFSVPVGGVYVASPGYMLSRGDIAQGSIITHVNGRETPDLGSFEAALAGHPDGAWVPLRHVPLANPRIPALSVVRVDRRWFDMQRCRRDDTTGRWPCEPSPPPPAGAGQLPASTNFVIEGPRPVRAVAPSLVIVDYDIPYRIDGVHGDRFQGTGLIVDVERGLVVVDRETVPIALGDLTVTFAGSVQVPGELVYLHPEHNLAVIRYDPALIGDTPVRAATLRPRDLVPGDGVWLVGLSASQRVLSRESRIARREPLAMPPAYPPRFREANLEVLTLADDAPTLGGVLTDGKGRVLAFWASFTAGTGKGSDSFFAGIPVRELERIVAPLREGREVGWRSLGVEFEPVTLSEARHRGLPEPEAHRLEAHDPAGRRALSVLRLAADSLAAERLREGDLLLSVDGRPASRFQDVQEAAQQEQVQLRVLRDGEPIDVVVPTEPLDGRGTTRAILWAGALLQRPPLSLARQRGLSRSGVYVSRYWFGSPAERYGLQATHRILEVDGVETPDLDTFLEVVRDKPDRGSVRLKTIDLEGKVAVDSLKLDLDYWPTWELDLGATGWQRRQPSVASPAAAARKP